MERYDSEDDEVLAPQLGTSSADISTDDRLRPDRLVDFQGQAAVKENLSVFISAARGRAEALDHVFLNGPPGLGKTTLAAIIAHELGAEFKVTSAPVLEKPRDLAGILTTITAGTVFFIDEIHRLKPVLEEMLYIAMEDFQLDWVIGQGPSARSVRIPVPPFTLIGATTKAGAVSSPLMTRFGIHVRLDLYSPEEMLMVLSRSAQILELDVDAEALDLLSRSARGTPRVANRLLRRMRDFAQVLGSGMVDGNIVRTGLGRLGIDKMGLEEQDRRLLRTIIEHYGGGPVGAETLAISLGESSDTLEDVYEPYLIQLGMIKRTPRGRMATMRGFEHVGLADLWRKPETGGPLEDQGLLF